MNNYKQPGDVLTFIAPAGGVVAGRGYRIGAFFVVAAVTAAAAAEFEGQVVGVFELAKTSAQAWVVGDQIYWDAANLRADTSSGVGPLIGVATAVAANPSSVGSVRLNGTALGSGGTGGGTVDADSPTPVSKLGAGAIALTPAEVLAGILVIDCGGAGRTVTLPDADDLVAAVAGAAVGDVIKLYVVNGSDANEAITLAAGTGGGFDSNQTAASRIVAQNASKYVHVRLTNVTAAAEAYVIYA